MMAVVDFEVTVGVLLGLNEDLLQLTDLQSFSTQRLPVVCVQLLQERSGLVRGEHRLKLQNFIDHRYQARKE